MRAVRFSALLLLLPAVFACLAFGQQQQNVPDAPAPQTSVRPAQRSYPATRIPPRFEGPGRSRQRHIARPAGRANSRRAFPTDTAPAHRPRSRPRPPTPSSKPRPKPAPPARSLSTRLGSASLRSSSRSPSRTSMARTSPACPGGASKSMRMASSSASSGSPPTHIPSPSPSSSTPLFPPTSWTRSTKASPSSPTG